MLLFNQRMLRFKLVSSWLAHTPFVPPECACFSIIVGLWGGNLGSFGGTGTRELAQKELRRLARLEHVLYFGGDQGLRHVVLFLSLYWRWAMWVHDKPGLVLCLLLELGGAGLRHRKPGRPFFWNVKDSDFMNTLWVRRHIDSRAVFPLPPSSSRVIGSR